MEKELIIFFDKIKNAHSLNYPFVVYRKPNEQKVSTYIQNSKKLFELSSINEQGFVFAPFGKNEKTILFPIDKCKKNDIEISTTKLLEVNLDKSIFEIISKKKLEREHIQLVEKGIDFIKSGNAKKIVLSREESIEFKDIDVVNIFKKMLNKYHNAFVYLWFHPSVGLWMGATPEKLISVSRNSFKTMALAGTQPYKGTIKVQWKQKEIQEQQFVTDFILENIKGNVEHIKISKPYTVKAGNLLHIRTDIVGNLKARNSLKDLLTLLHPTPAVCGLPKEIAMEFILKNENYTRTYYAGYLGELNIENTTNLVVNLRCLQLINNNILVYVGGGITVDSNSKKEWEETRVKANTIMNIL